MESVTSELPRDPAGTDATRPVPTASSDTDATRPVPAHSSASTRLGEFELTEKVGEGGMGVVWQGRSDDGRDVAVKVLREHIAGDEQARERLRREVQTLSKVSHPRVASVVTADVDGKAPYIVTDFVPGRRLDDVVEEDGPLQGQRLLQLGRGLGEALHAIHAAGIVHRDLKPGNVLMVGEDPVVIDFGIAQLADDVRLTMTGMVMGTPGYLSPEVVEGAAVSEATDWWGWAAILAYAASGQPPFGRGPVTVVLDRVARGRMQLEEIDERLRPLLAAALDPDPGRRPSEQQVLEGLERYARGEDVTTVLPAWAQPQTTAVRPEPEQADLTRVQPLTDPTRIAPVQQPPQQYQQPAPQYQQQLQHQPPGQPQPSVDPRIGRSARSGTLAGLLVTFVGLAATAPLLAWGLYAVWGVLVRTLDRSLTGLVLRRHEAGQRRSDVPMAVMSSPLHLLSALIGTVFALLLPLAFALAVTVGVSWASTAPGALPGGGFAVDHPLPLGLGALVGAWLAWWGPGSTSLRRGSRTVVRGVMPPGPVTWIVVTLLVAGGLSLAGWAWFDAQPVSWWPLPPELNPRDWLPFLP